MKQSRQKDVYVAVPEAGGDDHALAVDDFRIAGNSDGRAGARGNYVAVVDENRAVFDGRLSGGGIDFGSHQCKIGGMASANSTNDPKDQKWEQQTASHGGRIRS